MIRPGFLLPSRQTCACVLTRFSCVQLFVTLGTVACQAPLSLEFSLQEYWRGLPFPSLEDPSDPGIKFSSPLSHWGGPPYPQATFISKASRKPLAPLGFLRPSDLPCSPNFSLVRGERHFLCDIDNILLYLFAFQFFLTQFQRLS